MFFGGMILAFIFLALFPISRGGSNQDDARVQP
jgi:hypothetical protein